MADIQIKDTTELIESNFDSNDKYPVQRPGNANNHALLSSLLSYFQKIISGVSGNLVSMGASGQMEDSGKSFETTITDDDTKVPTSGAVIDYVAMHTGVIQMYSGSSAPTGWLLCDGSIVSQSTYTELYAICGTTYDTGGEGAGNFRLPDFRGIFPRGAGTNHSLQNANGNYFSGTLGTYENDKGQGHKHLLVASETATASALNNGNQIAYSRNAGNDYSYGIDNGASSLAADKGLSAVPRADGTNGTPRTGLETNPANLGINFIIKT